MNILPRPKPVAEGLEYSKEPWYFQTSKVLLPPLPAPCDYMYQVARELALITGRQVEFKDHRDNDCAVWGDFGSFIIK